MSVIGINLLGKTVQLRQSFFYKELNAEDHPFICKGGFGCDPGALGTKIYGLFPRDGEEAVIHRQDVEKILAD